MKPLSNLFSHLARPLDQWHRWQRRLPAYYFSGCKNMGDLLTHYLLIHLYTEELATHRPVQVYSRRLPHLLGVGSILHRATPASWVWGSGVIAPQYLPESIQAQQILALRGPISRKYLADHLALTLPQDLPLGDPGLLMPWCYPKRHPLPNAGTQHPAVRYRIGLIPHYVDADLTRRILAHIKTHLHTKERCLEDIVIIDIQQDPEPFIDQLLACNYLYSSSLHGLIMADAYGIPNHWLRLTDQIIGGSFKFMDYYATTLDPQQRPSCPQQPKDWLPLLRDPEFFCSVKPSHVDLKRLHAALYPALQQLLE